MTSKNSIKYFERICLLCLFSVFITTMSCGNRQKTEQTESKEPIDNTKRITIVFGGDVMQHMPQVEAARYDSLYNYDESFKYLKPFFDSIDLVILNFETTVSANKQYTGYPLFASPPAIMSALKKSGVDAVMLANNHICDRAEAGIKATVAEAERVGLRYSGAFADSAGYETNHPLMLDVKGIKLAILNYTYATNGMPIPKGTIVNLIDTLRIKHDLQRVKRESADHTIVFFHWGNEYSRQPSVEQRNLAEWCHKQGVDFVIGSHPHVLMPIEAIRDSSERLNGITAFSLGNLISNQRWRHSDGGMLLKMELIQRDSMPVEIDVNYMLAWVDTPVIDGKRRYVILPSPVADTMLQNDVSSKQKYDLFISDSRKLLDDSGILEMDFQ